MYKRKKIFWRPLINVWAQFSDEIILQILLQLSVLDLIHVSQVCRKFHGLSKDNSLWKIHYHNFWCISCKYSFKSVTDNFRLIDISDTCINSLFPGFHFGLKINFPPFNQIDKTIKGTGILIGIATIEFNGLITVPWFILDGDNNRVSFWDNVKNEKDLQKARIMISDNQSYSLKNVNYTLYKQRMIELNSIIKRNSVIE